VTKYGTMAQYPYSRPLLNKVEGPPSLGLPSYKGPAPLAGDPALAFKVGPSHPVRPVEGGLPLP